MTDYVKLAACRGVKPCLAGEGAHHSRSRVVARLLGERQVARFLTAPRGFGKTMVVLEYADVMFSCRHVFWFDCTSPCFIRDLDKGSLSRDIKEIDPQAELTVFEDVPLLSDARSEEFSRVIDDLLERGCEVLVTLTPAADGFGTRQPDRLVIGVRDLLLTDDELRVHPPAPVGNCENLPLPLRLVVERIPGFVWGGDAGVRAVLEGTSGDPLTAETHLALFGILAMGTCKVSQLTMLCLRARSHGKRLAQLYPFVYADEASDELWAAPFPAAAVIDAYRSRGESLASAFAVDWARSNDFRTKGEGKEPLGYGQLICLVASLMLTDNAARACELVGELKSEAVRATWLVEQGPRLLLASAYAPAVGLHGMMRRVSALDRSTILAREALMYLVLGLDDLARERAASVLDAVGTSREASVWASVVTLLRAEGDKLGRKASRVVLREVLSLGAKDEARRAWEVLPERFRQGDDPWMLFYLPFAAMALSFDEACAGASFDCAAFGQVLQDCMDCASAGAHPDAVALCIALALETAISKQGTVASSRDCACALAYVDAYLAEKAESQNLAGEGGFVTLRVLHVATSVHAKRGSADSVNRACRQACFELSIERAVQVKQLESPNEREAIEPELPKSLPVVRGTEVVRPLYIRMFGGLSISFGGEEIDPSVVRRQKIKTLLAILAVNLGREVPRDKLVAQIWPDAPLSSGRRNFYTVCSQLRKVLTTPQGDCPYLVHLQNGYKLDDRYVACDVRRVEEICRMFMVGRVDADSWLAALDELKDVYADDLLPADRENEAVDMLRVEYRLRITDSLVSATLRLLEYGEAQAPLWFARTAMRIDRTREDVFVALMRAQLASGQRTAALDTYFELRTFLVDELGIDPSAEAVEIYRSIIEEEADFE